MAKQSGIHQLRGKVGEHSYYRQNGIVPGLMRSINQGLSSRVKTSEEYANTRRNNVEFGGAADVAKLLGQSVQPKFRPMFLNFSQAILTKDILEIVKSNTGVWGQRSVNANNTSRLCDSLSSLAKFVYPSHFGEVSSVAGETSETTTIDITMSADQVSALISLGATGCVFKALVYQLLTGKYSDSTGKIVDGRLVLVSTSTDDEEFTEGSAVDAEWLNVAAVPSGITPPPTTEEHNIIVIVAMPYRTVGSINYTLQELCSFKALPAIIAD